MYTQKTLYKKCTQFNAIFLKNKLPSEIKFETPYQSFNQNLKPSFLWNKWIFRRQRTCLFVLIIITTVFIFPDPECLSYCIGSFYTARHDTLIESNWFSISGLWWINGGLWEYRYFVGILSSWAVWKRPYAENVCYA